MICFAVMFCIPVISSKAQETSANLKGISTLYVVIEALPAGAKTLGLSKDAIQTDVELKLRLAGIRIVTPEEGKNLPGRAFVYIAVSVANDARAADFDIYLDQDARLERNSQFAPAVETWRTGSLISNPSAQGIRTEIKDGIDEFLNAWLSVNPRK